MVSVSSELLNEKSTWCWLVTASDTLVSMVFCSDRLGPVEVVYCTGRRMRSVLPILAPDCAKLSSYSRLMDPIKLSFWWRIASALAVSMLTGSSVFVAGMVASATVGLRTGAARNGLTPDQAVVASTEWLIRSGKAAQTTGGGTPRGVADPLPGRRRHAARCLAARCPHQTKSGELRLNGGAAG